MHVRDVLFKANEVLRGSLDAEILLSHILKKRREEIFAHPEMPVSNRDALKFEQGVKQRSSGVPLAYITNHREFYKLDFYVDECVLIPRPETEAVTEKAIELCEGLSEPFLCDVGTGSGCLAIALAKNLPAGKFFAVDISEDALAVAKRNAKSHGVESRIEFLKSDLLGEVIDRAFNGIVANLPYIGLEENNFVEKEVLDHEPHTALFGGSSGFELFDKMFGQIKEMAARPKWLVGEMGFSQKDGMEKLIKRHFGRARVAWQSDLAGLDRTFTIYF
ncbi:MAG: peptide chain release factor N(5)-glutamine methyltransferase [Patescibacteria group bacterium]